ASPGIDWESPAWTPAERLVLARGSRLRFTVLCVGKLLVNQRWFFFGIFLMILVSVMLRILLLEYVGWRLWDALLGGAILAFLVWLPAQFYFGRSRRLARLQKLLAWGRWREMLQFLPKTPASLSP